MEYDGDTGTQLLDAEELVDLFHPKFVPYIQQLLLKGKIGLCSGHIQLADIILHHEDFERLPRSSDRFKVVIPYGGHTMTWDILFDSQTPEFAPDFSFDDSTFLSNADVDILEKNVPSWANWNPADPEALLNVIQELVTYYCKHQISLLDGYQRLQFEYSALVGETEVSAKDVEIFLGKSPRAGTSRPTNFLVRLPVDFTPLPPLLTKYNPGEDAAVLLVTFHSPDGNRITSKLLLSPGIENVLSGSSQVHLPPFPSNGCLMDYVPTVMKILSARVDTVVAGFEKRKEFVATFTLLFERNLIDIDMLDSISFLMEHKDFYFWVAILIPSEFPQDRPVLTFFSAYHVTRDKPFREKSVDYPYSPRWSAEEMVQRIKAHILEHAEVFMRNSIRSNQL